MYMVVLQAITLTCTLRKMEIPHYALFRGVIKWYNHDEGDTPLRTVPLPLRTVSNTHFGVFSEQSVFSRILITLIQYCCHDTELSGVSPSQEYSYYFVMQSLLHAQ